MNKDNQTPGHQRSELDPPMGRYIKNKLEDYETEMEERHGAKYTSIDLMHSPDLLVKGMFWLNAYIVTRLPELVFIHIRALAEGVYDRVTKSGRPKL